MDVGVHGTRGLAAGAALAAGGIATGPLAIFAEQQVDDGERGRQPAGARGRHDQVGVGQAVGGGELAQLAEAFGSVYELVESHDGRRRYEAANPPPLRKLYP